MYIPKSNKSPRYGLSCVGITICVIPKSTKYTISTGMDANAGISILCRHLMSNRSSPTPNRTTACSEITADK